MGSYILRRLALIIPTLLGIMLLNFVMGAMFLVLPGFWIASLGWVGFRAGQAIQGMTEGTKGGAQAGGKGAGAMSGGKLK